MDKKLKVYTACMIPYEGYHFEANNNYIVDDLDGCEFVKKEDYEKEITELKSEIEKLTLKNK